MLPYLLFSFVGGLFGISLMTVLYILSYPINLFSALFHLFHYMDLLNMISVYCSKTSNTQKTLDALSMTITMMIYQFIIYLTTTMVNLILYNKFYLVAICINFCILAIYHSFYTYNNLWQYRNIQMFYRIDMHEKLWPYYIGYGSLATIMYIHSNHPIMLGFYNIYMAMIISLPFLLPPKYPRSEMPYFQINLTVFAWMTNIIVMITKKIMAKLGSNPDQS